MRHMKWLLALEALVLCTILVVGGAAQGESWSAYLYNNLTRELVRVSLDGTQQAFDLGLGENVYLGTRDTDFTSDGSTMAYCVSDYAAVNPQAPSAPPTTVFVRNLQTGAVNYQLDVGGSIGCWVSYSQDNSRLALGIVRYYPGDPSADTTQPSWELQVRDAASGNLMAQLSPFSQTAPELGLFNDFALMPDVRSFVGDVIAFAGVPWGTEGIPIEPAFEWNFSANTVTPNDVWWRWAVSSLPETGELVWLDSDSTLPMGDPGGPVPRMNVAMYVPSPAGERTTIYHSPDWILLGTQFINNGEQIALQLLEPFDPNSAQPSSRTRWVAVDRQGNVSELTTNEGYTQIVSAPDGYLHLYATSSMPNTTMNLEYHAGGTSTTLWTGQSENSGAAWSIIWAQPVPATAGLQAFTAAS